MEERINNYENLSLEEKINAVKVEMQMIELNFRFGVIPSEALKDEEERYATLQKRHIELQNTIILQNIRK